MAHIVLFNGFRQVPYTFLGRNAVRPIIEEAVKWINRGGLAEQERLAAQPLAPGVTKPELALSINVGNNAGGPTATSQMLRRLWMLSWIFLPRLQGQRLTLTALTLATRPHRSMWPPANTLSK